MAYLTPIINNWYLSVDDRSVFFEVVAIDEQARTIEIQDQDGSLDDIDFETWFAMRLVEAAAPNDWSVPYEVELDESDDLNLDAFVTAVANQIESEMSHSINQE